MSELFCANDNLKGMIVIGFQNLRYLRLSYRSSILLTHVLDNCGGEGTPDVEYGKGREGDKVTDGLHSGD